jgi:hypothetical protein
LEHLEVTKKSIFTLNTGYILETDHAVIESIMSSKRVFIRQGAKYYNLRPVAKKITNKDTERALIQFDIEFQLNRENNAKTYSL